jgi:hypothetical protein
MDLWARRFNRASFWPRRGVTEPRLTAEVLLCHALGQEKIYLYAHPEEELSRSPGSTTAAISMNAWRESPPSTSPGGRNSTGAISP